MAQTPPLDELVDFPTAFTFRVVAQATEVLEDQVREIVETCLQRPIMNVGTQASSGGRFSSVRVMATVLDADEVHRTYKALNEVPNLKMLL